MRPKAGRTGAIFNQKSKIKHRKCAEWDWIDRKAFWADCTIDEGQHARDFAARTLRARVERQAVYVVVRLVEPFKPPTARAELSVEIVAPKERAYANRDLVYEIKVANRGPEDAPNLVMHGAGFASNEFVSMTAPERGRGRWRQNGSNFRCRLDLLEKNTAAVFLLTALGATVTVGAGLVPARSSLD